MGRREDCGPTATIYENSQRNCFAHTKRPQLIVGMSAPTSGTGYGEYQVEIGAALSVAVERPRSYTSPCLNQINTSRSGRLRFYAAFRALRDGAVTGMQTRRL